MRLHLQATFKALLAATAGGAVGYWALRLYEAVPLAHFVSLLNRERLVLLASAKRRLGACIFSAVLGILRRIGAVV